MANRTDLLTLDSNQLVLARDAQGARRLTVQREPADPSDMTPFSETIPFGSWGMGASVLAARNQMDYSLDCDVEQFGQLGPGMKQNKFGLALDYPVNILRVARDQGTATAATSGGTFADDSATGTITWTNPSDAISSNNVYATAVTAGADTTHYLKVTNFGFAIPSTAAVLGIVVEYEAKTSVGTANSSIRLYKTGALVGTATAGSALSTSEVYGTVGSPVNLFGSGFLPSDINASTFGVGLSFTANQAMTISVDHVRLTVYYSPSNKYLYIGAGNVSTKVNLAPIGATTRFSTIETKTFTHGDNGNTLPFITDIVAIKEGPSSAPDTSGAGGWSARYSAQVSDGFLLFFFGSVAQIQQVDLIGSNAADTYRTLNATKAYGGVATIALALTNTAATVWKSTGVSGQNTGAFARLQSAPISTVTTDYTLSTTWVPVTPYQVGNFGSSVVALTEFQRGLVAAKMEGMYAFDQNGNSYLLFGSRSFQSDENGVNMLQWGTNLVIPTRQDLFEIPARMDATVGLSTLASNLSPVQGYPVSTASYGRYLYATFYDGTDSYIVKMRHRQSEPVPTEYLFFPQTKLTAHKSVAMLVSDDGASGGNVYLFYGTTSATANKYDVGYCLLDPASARTYATGGIWVSPRIGSPEKRTVLEKITAYGVGLSGTALWTPTVSWDDAAFAAVGAGTTANAVGRNVITFTPGTNDTGYMYQVKWSCTNSTATNNPRLRGTSLSAAQPGLPTGFQVYGQRQADTVDRLTFVVLASTADDDSKGGHLNTTASSIFASLKALVNAGTKTLVDEDYGTVSVAVKSVSYIEGPADGDAEAQRFIQVRANVVQNSA